jgi:hypothetical protein
MARRLLGSVLCIVGCCDKPNETSEASPSGPATSISLATYGLIQLARAVIQSRVFLWGEKTTTAIWYQPG